jgi:hypothetical protein
MSYERHDRLCDNMVKVSIQFSRAVLYDKISVSKNDFNQVKPHSPLAKCTYSHLLKLRREFGESGRNALVIHLSLVSRDVFPTYAWTEKHLLVIKTINSPLLTHKIAISLSLMRIYVLYFSDAYHCLSLKLTHKSAFKSRLLKFINFSLKRGVICLFRRRYGSKWRVYESKLNVLNVHDLLSTRVNDVV